MNLVQGSKMKHEIVLAALLFAGACFPAPRVFAQDSPRVIEILADHDSRFKIAGQQHPEITVKAGEKVILKITAVKAKNHNRDGSIHGFLLLRASNRKPVDGWDLLLKPGTQEFTLTAPAETGEYLVICSVICSSQHEGMQMRFLVVP